MIPGVTNLPPASMTVASAGTSTVAPTATILPSRTRIVPFGIDGPGRGQQRRVADRERPGDRGLVGARERIVARRREAALARRRRRLLGVGSGGRGRRGGGRGGGLGLLLGLRLGGGRLDQRDGEEAAGQRVKKCAHG